MKNVYQLLIALLLFCALNLHAQQIDSVLRGAYLFGEPRVDFTEMRNALHLNTIQYSTEYSASYDPGVLTNPGNLKVINQPAFYSSVSAAQKMEYEAEQDADTLKNYFAERPSGRTDGNVRKAEIGVHSAGYMVKSAWPDNEYFYGGGSRTLYYATFRLKVEGSYGNNPQVVNCYVYCKTHQNYLLTSTKSFNDFGGTTNWKDFVFTFSVVPSSCGSPCNQVKKMILLR
ncbi:MAG: hypothetical protein HY800_03200 [Ignavibacteriales bacterium]|nr:hypothetical protein [Ignavibacteriales bacterium]